jgi:hypothetical protein
MVRINRLGIFLICAILSGIGAPAVYAVLATDDFDSYTNGQLTNEPNIPDWITQSGVFATGMVVLNGQIQFENGNEVPPDQSIAGSSYAALQHTNEGYQRVSVDVQWQDPNNGGGLARVYLNYDPVAAVAGKQEAALYMLRMNLNNFGFWKRDASENDLHFSGWQTHSLAINTWYKMTLEKNGALLIATISTQDGLSILNQLIFEDTPEAEFTGGFAGLGMGLFNGLAHTPHMDNFEYEILDQAPAVTISFCDDFESYPDGHLDETTESVWQRANGANGAEEIWAGWPGVVITDSFDQVNGAYSGGPATGQALVNPFVPSSNIWTERIAVDFKWEDPLVTPNGGNLLHGVALNYDVFTDWGGGDILQSSAYLARTNGDVLFLSKRSRTQFVEYHDGPWHQIDPDLARDTWYTLELVKENWTLTASIYPQGDPTPIISTSLFDDGVTTAGARLTGGKPTFFSGEGPPPGFAVAQRDNFKYEVSRPAGPLFCGDSGTVFFDGDIDEDCSVDENDLDICIAQWLKCSDPTSPDFSLPPGVTPVKNLPRDTSITVDGDLSDWPASSPWFAMDELIVALGEPNDITEARLSARWDDTSDKLYVAVVVDEGTQHWNTDYTGSANQDMLEVFSDAGGSNGTGWANEYDLAQHYRVSPDTNSNGSSTWNGGSWQVWANGDTIAPAVGMTSAVNVAGSVTTYELAVPQFNSYQGLSAGGTTVLRDLMANDVIAFDLLVFTIKTFNVDIGWRAENTAVPKSDDAGTFARYTLVENLACGDLGYWSADTNLDCKVNFLDYADISTRWMQCSDPENAACDQYWQ